MRARLILTLFATLVATACHTTAPPKTQRKAAEPASDRAAAVSRRLRRHLAPPRSLSWRPAAPRLVGLGSPIA
ncbi:MAG TPA: hypothetical protein VHI98_10750 [Vicinamibacterales bacterium]|jgi:hypothetical protein|nr:hypothetical protein [Vicinamibacterales bacterium]